MRLGVAVALAILTIPHIAGPAAVQEEWKGPAPEAAGLPRDLAAHFTTYDVVLRPDKEAAEWWAGAPSVVRDDAGVFWMAARMRSPEAPRGARGYEIRLLRSTDGMQFETVHRISRDDVPVPGFERPALLIDPRTRLFKLYLCGAWNGGPWSVIKLDDAETPAAFRASTARPVITAPRRRDARDVGVHEYKDPVIVFAGDTFHAYVIGYVRQNERVFHLRSPDGEAWSPVGDVNQPMLDLGGWRNFFVRPASLLPLGIGYLFVYEGSSTRWYDPVYNVVTGLAFTFDLHTMVDLTPHAPLVVSSTPGRFHTWRYSHWMRVEDEIWIYAEVARPDDAHEIRRFRLPLSTMGAVVPRPQ
jgi:hypothetical protein